MDIVAELKKYRLYKSRISDYENYLTSTSYERDVTFTERKNYMEHKEKVASIENFLNSLSDDERFVIENFDVAGNPWWKVAELHKRQWGVYFSVETLRKKRQSALKKFKRL